MTGLFGKPKAPKMPTPPPTVDTPAVQAAADAERRRAANRQGQASTVLTSSSAQPMTATKKLLGE